MSAIEKVKALQKKLDLTDTEFANMIGVSRDNWNRIKNGKRPLNDKFLAKVQRAFPEVNFFVE